MANKIKLKIVTLEKVVYGDLVESVNIPTTSGRIGVLPGHVTLASILAPGEIVIEKKGEKHLMAVTTGFFEIRFNSEVVIMADSAEKIEEMNIEEIEKAKARVEQIMKEKQNLQDFEFAHFEEALAREIVRLNIARKYRHKLRLPK